MGSADGYLRDEARRPIPIAGIAPWFAWHYTENRGRTAGDAELQANGGMHGNHPLHAAVQHQGSRGTPEIVAGNAKLHTQRSNGKDHPRAS